MNIVLKIVCALSLCMNVWFVYAVPLKSIFLKEKSNRVWHDLNGRSIEATLIAVSPDGSICYLEKNTSQVPLEINVKYLSKKDRDILKQILVRNKYIFYNGEYCELRGLIDENHICVETYLNSDTKSSRYPMILTIQDFSLEWREILRKEIGQGCCDLSRYDSAVIEKMILYDENDEWCDVFTEVLDVLPEGLVARRIHKLKNSKIEIKSEALLSRSGVDISRYKKGDLISEDSTFKKRWFFCGWKLKSEDGKWSNIVFYSSNREDWLKLNVGWMERHQKDQLVIDRVIKKKYNNSLGDLSYAANCVVIIRGEKGQGTGFIMSEDQKTWLYTNEHVARLGTNILVETIMGRCYSLPKRVQVAVNRDLFRFEVQSEKYLRECSNDELSNEKAVVVLGNSDGGRVVTENYGYIIGVGPARIEVDAPFVKGNSGGPILRIDRMIDNNGRFIRYFYRGVIGVATEAEIRNQNNDWIKAGTRYDKPRRYGERFSKVEWDVVSWDAYCVSVSKLESFRSVCMVLCKIYAGENVSSKEYENVNTLGNHQLCTLLKEIQRRNLSVAEKTKAVEKGLGFVIKLLKKTKWATPRIANDGEQLLKSIEALQKFVKEGKGLVCQKNPSFSATEERIVGRDTDKRNDKRYILRLEGAQIIADDGTFLGRITWNDCASDSIFNSVGQYGSEVSSTSIWNDISKYGSDYSSESAFNDFASSPPRILKGGEVIGYLTTNDYKVRAINPKCLLEILDKNADKMYRKKLLRIK